jgi:hypothetical protein
MSKEWEEGYKAGYDAGYIAASNHYIREQKSQSKSIPIHDPGSTYREDNFPGLSSTQISSLTVEDIENLDRDYEKAYGHAVYRSMKQAHEFK